MNGMNGFSIPHPLTIVWLYVRKLEVSITILKGLAVLKIHNFWGQATGIFAPTT
jgi:hypothetical protein